MSLRELTDEFLEENNPLISVGKAMSEQMVQMADFARGRGDLQGKADMINTAKAVAANGNSIFKLAQSICRQCRDQKTRNNLQCCAEAIPTLSTQLTMLASVRSSTGNINYAVRGPQYKYCNVLGQQKCIGFGSSGIKLCTIKLFYCHSYSKTFIIFFSF